jgi:hypothetical protein
MSIYLIILNIRMCTLSKYEKNGIPGAQDEKRPRECHYVDDGMLIPWLKTDQKKDTRSSRNGVWKFGRKAYI